MTPQEAIWEVMAAATPADLFGTDEPARRYRRLARALHPDTTGGTPAATRAFVRLTDLWHGRDAVLLRTQAGAAYRLGRRRYDGDVADLYDVGDDRLLKLVRNPANGDLIRREERALRRIGEHGDPRHLVYVPRLVDAFDHRDPSTGARRRVVVTATAPRLRTLADVRAEHPDGLDARDVAWMWRRLLVALGLAHRAGVVHGAVLPDHVLIEPDEHGVVLVDWCYSTVGGDRVPALVPAYATWYPAEVTARQRPGPGTDIAMATRCMTDLMGVRAPGPLRSFAAGCSLPALRQRPDDAWRLLTELDEILGRLYGPRRFRPFRMNSSTVH